MHPGPARLVDTGVLCLLLIAVSALPVAAQQPGVIGGSVVAAESGQPVAGATITVARAADTAAVASVATTEGGRFRVTGLALGRYRVLITFLGYTDVRADSVELTAESPERELTVRLSVAPVELDAIEAETERSPVQILTDRTVYTTKDMPASKGGTATDLLRQVPELEVDVNGNVSLRGNQSVAIHLNGRPAPMKGDALTNFLQQMPADRIARVEVMPSPGAREDPEGTGGIVNIVLDEDVDLGLSGSLTARGGTRGSRGFNGQLAYQKGRLTVFGGAGMNFNDDTNDTWDVRRNLLASPVTVLEQQGETAHENVFTQFDFTAEYKLAENTTAWLSGTGWGGGSENVSSMLYDLSADGGATLDRFDRITDSEYDNNATDFGAGVKHVFEAQRHELTVDLRRNDYGYGGASYIEKLSRLDPGLPLTETRSTDQDSDNRGTTLRIDYTRPLGEKGKIDAGVNISRRRLDEASLTEVFDAAADADPLTVEDSRFGHYEDFNTLYVTAAQTFGDLGVQLGVRAELAETDFTLLATDETFENDYRSLFPNVNLSYTLAQGQTVRFTYSRRISRPWAGMLNPYTPVTDPLNRREGNPHLDPSYTHSFGLDYSRVGSLGTLRIAPSYRRTSDGWENIKRVDANGVSIVSYQNSLSTEYMGSNVTASMRPAGRFNGSLTLGVYRTITDASNISPEFSRDSWRWSLGGNTSARITESLNMQLNANYSPAREVPQGRISSIFYSGLSLRQQLLNNKATISLFVNDPFGLYEYRFETRDRTHVQSGTTSWNFRSASLSFTWNFGKAPEQVSRRGEGQSQAEDAVRIR